MSQLFYTLSIILFVFPIYDVGCQERLYLERQKPVMQKALTYLNECQRQVPLDRDNANNEANCQNFFTYFTKLFNDTVRSFNFTKEVEECGLGLPAHAGTSTSKRNKRMVLKDVGVDPLETNANITNYPWTVWIHVKANITFITRNKNNYKLLTTKVRSHSSYCTGSIIHQRFILTAAHCIEAARDAFFGSVVWQENENFEHKMKIDVNEEELFDIVSVELSEIQVHMGELFMDPKTMGFLYPPTKTVHIEKHNIKYEIHPGFLSLEEKRWLLHQPFTDDDERKYFYFLPPEMYNDAVSAHISEYYSTHDIALIYIPKSVYKITYTEIIKPVCLPAYHPKDYKSCALQYYEEFHMAGYGLTQFGPGLETIYAAGLNRAKFHLLITYAYDGKCGEVLKTLAVEGQHATPLEKVAADSKDYVMRGAGKGDSGAAGVVTRNLHPKKLTTPQSKRSTQMAVQVTGSASSLEYGSQEFVDVLSHIQWLAQAMIHLWICDPDQD